MPSGHKAFVVNNPGDVDLLLMHNRTYAAEYEPQDPHRLSDAYKFQNITFSIIEEKGGYSSKGENVGCQGYECKGEGHSGNMRVLQGVV